MISSTFLGPLGLDLEGLYSHRPERRCQKTVPCRLGLLPSPDDVLHVAEVTFIFGRLTSEMLTQHTTGIFIALAIAPDEIEPDAALAWDALNDGLDPFKVSRRIDNRQFAVKAEVVEFEFRVHASFPCLMAF
ncbi:hypothetical protein RBU00_19640 [Rhizobium sp. AN63]|uniref:hypothetical protein n=1 Tax=Rhizobium sp. AN63 TaxID=3035210 RepID=UPI0027D3C7F7|nr:hypothetical protein [Rhizobium sp. AN63]MDQ4408121.1 hypothetical protein [Rhizobium sp. AN63]